MRFISSLLVLSKQLSEYSTMLVRPSTLSAAASALTYIDEEEPSRLDYGKHKFGGPFTEEEVEDVKTILRMLAFFVIISIGYVFSGDPQSLIHAHIIPSAVDTRSCMC